MSVSPSKTVLLLGASGMLGQDVASVAEEVGCHLVRAVLDSTDTSVRADCAVDIRKPASIAAALQTIQPDWIINCAAYTAVDQAETAYNDAFAVNAYGAAACAGAAAKVNCKLLHISTDYVFGAVEPESKAPWREDDQTAPCGIYGHSKYCGERLVASILPNDHLIVRTSWLHGIHGNNFLDTMLRLGAEREELSIVDDQIGSPTWTGWLARCLLQLIEQDARGTVHASSRGNISWYDFAEEIFRQAGITVRLYRQSTEQLNRPAPRPKYSTLNVDKLEQLLDRPVIDWKAGVAGHLAARKEAIGES